jgi:deoxyguanosine kinase|tara:strand:+ start:17167 stop:17874 length:708 start_codon:yes stop_codon:yes gene_type:complete
VEESLFKNLDIEISTASLPNYIAVEGPIGVGKTTLAKRLATSFNYETLLEEAETNPFLERFYRDRRTHALPVQLHFLFQRMQKLQALRQGDIFQQVRVSDFLIEKDPLFARVTLDDDEYRLYQTVYDNIITDLPKPDLVIYLQAPTSTLYERLQKRGNAIEKPIEQSYLQQLNDAYTQFFYHYDDTPLLIVNTSVINLSTGEDDYQNLVRYILQTNSGRHYYNPHSLEGKLALSS